MQSSVSFCLLRMCADRVQEVVPVILERPGSRWRRIMPVFSVRVPTAPATSIVVRRTRMCACGSGSGSVQAHEKITGIARWHQAPEQHGHHFARIHVGEKTDT